MLGSFKQKYKTNFIVWTHQLLCEKGYKGEGHADSDALSVHVLEFTDMYEYYRLRTG